MSSEYDPAANRRRFLQYLAASPLLAAGGAQALAETILPKTMVPDPLMWGPRQSDHLIKTPKEAINVFDLEPVCRQNVPPAHFGYMASGIDDEVTLRANREGFLKFQLRPRRLVDVSKVDMSVDILGTKYCSPIVCAPVGGQRSFHDDAESGVARAAKAGDHLQILSTMTSDTVEDVIKARGAPIWMQLYATNKWEVAAAITKRAENAGCTALAVTVDRSGGRNQETLVRLRPSRHPRLQRLPRPQQPAIEPEDPRDVEGPRSHRAPQHPVVGHDLGLLQADARPHQDEAPGQGHPGLGGRGDGGRRRPRRHHRVEPRRPLGGFRPLHHRRAAGDRRSGEGPHPDPGGLRASAAAPTW